MIEFSSVGVAEQIAEIQADISQAEGSCKDSKDLREKAERVIELEGQLNSGEGEIYSGPRKAS